MINYRMSVFGGAVFGLLPNLPVENIFITICMAVLGTLTSFFVTFVVKWISEQTKKE